MKFAIPPLLAICTATGSSVWAEEGVTTISLEERSVLLSDLAILPESIATKYGSRAVAEFSVHSDVLELTEARRRQLVRRQLPVLAVRLRHRGTVRFHSDPAMRQAVSRPCYALMSPVAAGAFVEAVNVEQTTCRDGDVQPPLRYVAAARMVAATQRIEAGHYLGPVYIPYGNAVAAGAELTLISRQGPITIKRGVTTLQAAPQGSKVFVRTEGSEIISATISSNEER